VAESREALVVLGAIRSGASAVARGLSLVGAKLPAAIVGDEDGAYGPWEPQAVVDLNNKILTDLDSSWLDPFGPRGARDKPPLLDRYLDEAREALRRSYGAEQVIVIKEPRISILLDLWKAALLQEGFRISFVIVVRHPLEAAESLRETHGFIRDKSMLLWATYMLAAEHGTRGEKRVFVNYDDLLADPESSLEKIEAGLSLEFQRRSWDAVLDVQEELKADRRRRADRGRKTTPPHLSGIEKLYDYFDAASRGQPWNTDIADEVGAWLANIEQSSGGLIKDEERRRRIAEALAADLVQARDRFQERARDLEYQVGIWTERTHEASGRAETLEADLASARAAIQVLRQHHDEQLAPLEQARAEIDQERVELARERATFDQHRSELEQQLDAKLSELNAELAEAEAEARRIAVRCAELQETLTQTEARGAALAGEVQTVRDQSSDLARELTAAIADRSQLKKYSAAGGQLAFLRRLWPFR
jgi:predicted  nucleic acid-binding Zn-ribbon protein